ncbi:MAG TPA: hypothetical protein VN891_15895, partial [Steroidobacteraceae bacterium]|nr:hypothetical protein [Steroidobacteraceae bacterium]
MSSSNTQRNWLLPSVICGVTLCLTTSNFHTDPAAATVRAARTGLVKSPAPALLPAHRSVAASFARRHYIVQSQSSEMARNAVSVAGGIVTGDLSVIRAVAAALDEREIAALRAEQLPQLHVYDDSTVIASSMGTLPETYYPSEVDAANLQVGGMTGRGVTVAVIDSGLWNQEGPLQSAPGESRSRVLAQYDVILARQNPHYYLPPLLETYSRDISDPYGHGTHVT